MLVAASDARSRPIHDHKARIIVEVRAPEIAVTDNSTEDVVLPLVACLNSCV